MSKLISRFIKQQEEFFHNQMEKHGDVGGYTDISEWLDSFSISELIDKLNDAETSQCCCDCCARGGE